MVQQVARRNTKVAHSIGIAQLQHMEHCLQHEPPPYIHVVEVYQQRGIPLMHASILLR
jgi:hypothetical protein